MIEKLDSDDFIRALVLQRLHDNPVSVSDTEDGYSLSMEDEVYDFLNRITLEEREITQMHFSKSSGIAQSTISDWKRKKTNPPVEKMFICNVLKVTSYELLQDTVQSVEELDYRVVTKGTKENYFLLKMD